MVEPQAAPANPSGPSALRTLGHFLRGGLLGGVVGCAFAVLLFYLLVLGFLYAGQAVQGADQEKIAIPHLPDVVLTPPIAPVDLEPPSGKQDKAVDVDYLGACWGRIWEGIDLGKTWPTLAAWTGVAALFGLAIGLTGALLQLLLGHYWSPLLGVLALCTALAGIGVFVSRDQLPITLPFELDSQGRLLIYTAVATMNLWWISIAGFRFRALLFILATVLVGEALQLGLPPDKWTTTALWHACLFLFVPTGYAWLAVERGQTKNII